MKTLMSGNIIRYRGDNYKVVMIGKSEFVAIKYPELDRSKSIVIKLNSKEWRFY